MGFIKGFFVFLFLILVIILILFGARIYLYAKFLLGNDILIDLKTDKEDFYLLNGQQETISFQMSTVTNIFCKARCNLTWNDLSKGEVLDNQEINLFPINPIKKEYTLKADENQKGMKFYRFDFECNSIKSTLCDTDEKLTSKSIFITLEYDFSGEQLLLMNQTRNELLVYADNLNSISKNLSVLNKTLNDFDNVSVKSLLTPLIKRNEEKVASSSAKIQELSLGWGKEGIELTNNKIQGSINEIRSGIVDYADTITLINNEASKERIKKEVQLLIEYSTLCDINGLCSNKKTIADIAQGDLSNTNKICGDLNNLKTVYLNANSSLKEEFNKQNYPQDSGFWKNVSLILEDIKSSKNNLYLNQMPKNESNSELIKETIKPLLLNNINNYTGYDLNPALIVELLNNIPACNDSYFVYNNLNSLFENNLKAGSLNYTSFNLIFSEPKSYCCIFGNCGLCCNNETCKNNPATYPIIFLHGHDFSKGTSADYSLNAFSDLQKRLGEEGYLDAGIFSLDYNHNFSNPSWSKINSPITLRGTYYLDVFKGPEKVISVQTKGDNIDTYAIRLKELIEDVKTKTQRPKVVLVTHSMGGIVVRRYLQIFGEENVEKAIFVASPNKGISGSVSTYCPVFGEKIECSDLNSDSLVINKLNSGELPKIPVYNLVGIGCKMDKEFGDGIVTESSAVLEEKPNIKNYYFNGSCSALRIFHTEILNSEGYPEVYDIIKSALKNQNSTPF